MSIYPSDNAYGIKLRTRESTSVLPGTVLAVWCLAFAFLTLYTFSAPAWIDSDTMSLMLYFKLLFSGTPVPTEANTIPQLLPILIDGAVWSVTHSFRVLQTVSILAFSTGITCLFVVIARFFGTLAASLSLAGILSSVPTLTMVLWGRSPVWAMLFLASALVYITARPVTEKRLHITLLLSLAATLCRTDFITLHLALVIMAVLFEAEKRSWLSAFRLALWSFGALTPVATDFLVTRNPYFTREAGRFYYDTRHAFDILINRPDAATAARPPRLAGALALIRKGMNSPGHLFEYTYGLFIIPACIVFLRKSVIMTLITLIIAGATAAPAVILALNNTYGDRAFFAVRLLFILFSAIGAAAVLPLILRHPRRRIVITGILTTALLLAHLPAYQAHLTRRNQQANEFRQHDEQACALAQSALQLTAPVIVEPAYLASLYMLRLGRPYDGIISKYDFAFKTRMPGERLQNVTWIGHEPPATVLPALKITGQKDLYTNGSLHVTELQLAGQAPR